MPEITTDPPVRNTDGAPATPADGTVTSNDRTGKLYLACPEIAGEVIPLALPPRPHEKLPRHRCWCLAVSRGVA